MAYISSSWAAVGPPLTTGAAYYTSLAVDSLGVPVVAYQVGWLQRGAGGLEWSWVGCEWDGMGWGGGPCMHCLAGSAALTCPACSRPLQDVAQGERLFVQKLQGVQWVTLGGGPVSAGAADFVRLVLDPQGVPWVAYRVSLQE